MRWPDLKSGSYLHHFVLLILCLASYSDTLSGHFVFDDTVAIVKNQDVIERDAPLTRLFHHDFWGSNITDPNSHKSYRPLTILMFHLEYNLLSFRSAGMKAVNLMIHWVNTSLVFALFKRLTHRTKIATTGAVLFAIHPVHTEAVCGVVGRAELLFCLCFLLTLLLCDAMSRSEYKQSYTRFFVLVVLAILGLLFKENAISILPTCIVFNLILCNDYSCKFKLRNILLNRNTFLLTVTGALLAARLYVQNFSTPQFKPMDNPISAHESAISRVLSQNFIYTLNIWIMISPHWLCFDWAIGCVELVTSLFDRRLLAIVGFYYIVYRLLRSRNPIILIGLVLVVVPFLPACGILRVGFVIAERILYVPSIGFCLIVSVGFTKLQERFFRYSTLLNVAFALLCLIFICKTRLRASEWMTEEKLFESALLVCPRNAKVHYNVARLATDHGNKMKAFKHYHYAIKLYPEYEAALMNLGNLYRELKDFPTAEKYIKRAIDVFEEFPTAWMNLGIVQASQKKYHEAEQSYLRALRYKKRYAICYYNLGNLYLEMGNYTQAMHHWHQSVGLNPMQPKAWANILTLLDNREFYEDALHMSERALEYLPSDSSILFIRANVHGKLKQYVEAEKIYLRILQLAPANSMYHTNLAVLYHRWGKLDLAKRSYKNAIDFNPNSKTAKDNLGKLLAKSQ